MPAPAVAAALKSAGKDPNVIQGSVNALLVWLPGHVVLLDTGLGPTAKGNLPRSLAAAGVTPEQVTDVLITHAHGDHIGGLVTVDGRSAFPTATIHMATKEWAFFQDDQNPAKGIASAIAAQVKTFDPGIEILPGITAVAIEGHTPGHSGYEIASGSAHMFDIGDTVHNSVLSLGHPEWVMGFDSVKDLGKVARRATLERLAASHELVFAPHFPFPGTGRIVANGEAFSWQPAER